MSQLERPLLAKTIALTGDIALRAALTLRIKTNAQSWEPVNFLVDLGTEMTTLAAARAKQLGIPFPHKPVPRLGITGKSAEVRAGLIRARIDGMDPTEYVFPCYFRGDSSPLRGSIERLPADPAHVVPITRMPRADWTPPTMPSSHPLHAAYERYARLAGGERRDGPNIVRR
jgi:hypothetical protein